ncbi:MAG: hypothetical protein M1840_006756 [Geoglossum simile]|nr:MAG: hypothetical protein M1840_006756 [Geoglossum simile]
MSSQKYSIGLNTPSDWDIWIDMIKNKAKAAEWKIQNLHETISKAYYVYLIDKDTLHEMLSALKERIAPTDRARQCKLANQYWKIKKAPKSQNIKA